MARNIFSQIAPDPAEPAPPKAGKLPASVGGLRESLREITQNAIRDLDPDQIEADGLRDRLDLGDEIDALADSIQRHGQQVPILVRPAGTPDRYRIVYGRRRLAAIRKIGGPVKAIVRSLDDDASIIAQGQENNVRLDPSFIEKALFIRDMQAAGYKAGVIQDALGLSRQGVSNHRVVLDPLPDAVIEAIGPAHGIGRRQWAALGDLARKVPLDTVAPAALAALPDGADSPARFQAVFAAATGAAKGAPAAGPEVTVFEDAAGTRMATLTADGKAVALKVNRKDNPAFANWLANHPEEVLRCLIDAWTEGT